MDDILTTIEKYLAGDMSKQEHIAFAERLAKEPDLQAQLSQYQDSRGLLEQAVSLRLKKQMQQIQRPEKKVQNMLGLWRRWGVLAASFVLLMAGAFWWSNGSADNYQDHFEVYASTSGLRGAENTANTWQEAYQRKAYGLAKDKLIQIKEGEAEWVEAQFFLGNIALEEAQALEALTYFERVLERNSPRFASATQWYLLLAYWGVEDYTSARDLAKEIMMDEQHPYFQQTKRVFSKLAD